MACFRPLEAHKVRETGEVTLGGKDRHRGSFLELPCGRCVGCFQARAREWSIRMGHEAQLYDSNLFVTLDYNPESLPASRSLEYEDFQLFMKRLRKEFKGLTKAPNGQFPIRFFCAGEYGERFQRPHWHAILFNLRLPDMVRLLNGTSRSAMLEEIWGAGHAVIGDVTPASAAYVAGYTLHKAYARLQDYEDVLNLSTGELTARRREFVTMSRRPGIGAWWYEKFSRDLFPTDHAVQDGRSYKVPGYYWRKYQADEGVSDNEVEELRERRYQRAEAMDKGESSPERRSVREEVARRRLAFHQKRDH